MDCTQRYELIRPILQGDKTVRQVAKASGISKRTLYRYLSSAIANSCGGWAPPSTCVTNA